MAIPRTTTTNTAVDVGSVFHAKRRLSSSKPSASTTANKHIAMPSVRVRRGSKRQWPEAVVVPPYLKHDSSDWADTSSTNDSGLMASFAESHSSMATTATQTTIELPTPAHSIVSVPQVRQFIDRVRRPRMDDETLAGMGYQAKKRVEAIAQRKALIGDWRERHHRKRRRSGSSHGASIQPECQVMELRDTTKGDDEYKIVARMNVSSSLREIMSALATDKATDFNQSMQALFGTSFLCGERVHGFEKMDVRPSRRSSLASRRSSASSSRITRSSTSFSDVKVSLNSVTLMIRSRLSRKLRDANFLDYLDENVESMAVTRVLQSLDLDRLGLRSPSSSSTKTKGTSRLGNLLIGYVIREDAAAKFTRVFFYAEVTPASGTSRVSKAAVRLAQSLVDSLESLLTAVERKRLTSLYRLQRATESVPIAASRCCACESTFTGLPYFRRRQCACCRQTACHKCISYQEITDDEGNNGRHTISHDNTLHRRRVRVCQSCVDRVSLPSLLDRRATR